MWLNIDSSFLNVNHLVELFRLASVTRLYCVVSTTRPDAPRVSATSPPTSTSSARMVGSRPAPCDESGKVEPARRGEALERLAQHLALRSERRLRGGHLSIADAALSAVGLPVPEPSTWALLLIGFVSLALPRIVATREPIFRFLLV
jgi:PEP-CTERM motif